MGIMDNPWQDSSSHFEDFTSGSSVWQTDNSATIISSTKDEEESQPVSPQTYSSAEIIQAVEEEEYGEWIEAVEPGIVSPSAFRALQPEKLASPGTNIFEQKAPTHPEQPAKPDGESPSAEAKTSKSHETLASNSIKGKDEDFGGFVC